MEKSTSPKGINWFIIITFAISFSLAGLFILIFPNKDKIPYLVLGITYMFMPALGVLLTDKFVLKRSGFKGLAVNFKVNRWYIAAWPGMILISFFILGINILWPGISFSPDMSGFFERMAGTLNPEQIETANQQMKAIPIPLFWLAIIQMLVAGITINALAAFGEELGWRGFMVREYKHLKFWDVSFRIGIIWGIWHAPLILMGHNYPQHPIVGVGMMVLFCLALSPLFLYIRLKTHSVIGAAILHGTLNASAGLPLMYISGGNDLTAGMTGFAGIVALLLVCVIMVAYDRFLAPFPITNRTLLDAVKTQTPNETNE